MSPKSLASAVRHPPTRLSRDGILICASVLEILLHISGTDWRRLNLPRLTYQPAFVSRSSLSPI